MTNLMTFEDWLNANLFVHEHANGDSEAVISTDDIRAYFQASEANQQAEMDALKYDLDGYMKIAHASATEIVQQAQTIAELQTQLNQAKEAVETLNDGRPLGDIVGLHTAQNAIAQTLKHEQTIAELVEALESSKEILDGEGVYTKTVAKIDALIAKVKGATS